MTKKDKSVMNKVFMTTIGIALVVYSVTIVFVLGWGLMTSFKSVLDFTYAKNVMGLPNLDENVPWNSRDAVFEFSNYTEIFRLFPEVLQKMKKSFYVGETLVTHRANASVLGVFTNTFLYVVIGPLLQTLVPAIMAYATAKHDFKICKMIYGIALFSMIMPIVGNYTSAIDLLRNLGLYDTWLGFFAQKFFFGGMYFLVFHAFYSGLANSYSEAAEIDGASYYNILLSVILPLSIKMISSVWLIQFVHFWNDYQTPRLYMPTHPTLAYTIWTLTTNYSKVADVPTKVAGAMVLALPVLVFFIFFKDKLMGNVSMGGLKE